MRAVREAALPGTILQPTIVYGPYSRPWTIDPADMLRYGTVVLPDHGEGICNAVYVDDVVSAMILAAQHPAAWGALPGIRSRPGDWRDFAEAMARAARGGRAALSPRAAALARDGGPVRKLLRLATDPGLRAPPRRAGRAGPQADIDVPRRAAAGPARESPQPAVRPAHSATGAGASAQSPPPPVPAITGDNRIGQGAARARLRTSVRLRGRDGADCPLPAGGVRTAEAASVRRPTGD